MNDFKRYLDTLGYSPNTIASETKTITRFQQWLKVEDIPEGQIRYPDVLAYIDHNKERGIAQRSIEIMICAIKHYLNFLVDDGALVANPIAALTIKGVKRGSLYDVLSENQLDTLYQNFGPPQEFAPRKSQETYEKELLTWRRNRCMVGLLVYQGLTAGELTALQLPDLELAKSRIQVPRSRKANGRTLELSAQQVFDFREYLFRSREEILNLAGSHTDRLFFSFEVGLAMNNVMTKISRKLKAMHPGINTKLIRASVITNWLRHYNLRQVQRMAGHRFLSSTEKYRLNDLEGMSKLIEEFHPLG